MKINLEIALISALSSLAPYFFIWFSAICCSIGLLWFYTKKVGMYYFIK